MITRTIPEIDFSTFPDSDGQPMAETSATMIQLLDLIFALQTLFEVQGRAERVIVGGNQLVYYNEHNGWDHVSPDVYVVFDRAPPAPPTWQTWVRGKFPDIVFEITSLSTRTEDVGEGPKHKRALYTTLGVQEYYVYDPQGETTPPFRGFARREGRLEEQAREVSGGIGSALLGTELRPVASAQTARRPAARWLRVLDPRTGQPIAVSDEEHAALREEKQARQDAEERAARAEAALQALLGRS